MQPKQQIRTLVGVIGIPAVLMISAVLLLREPLENAPDAVSSKASIRKTASATTPAVRPDSGPLRPLPVSLKIGSHEWTSADATDPAIIEKIAHNVDEALRLAQENERIKRRQLVYRNETVPQLLDLARASGQPLKHFTLPGLDGKEVEVEVTEIRLADGQGGAIQGRVKGRFNSTVSVGFSNGCESFNVISPDDKLFLTADAREPGEVLVKEIDPEVYGRPPQTGVPDFIPTQEPLPGHSR